MNATEIIDMGEVPTKAIREKKDSSLVVAMKLVRDGKADAIVSAGSTGAILVGGQLVVGRIKGIKRPALAPFLSLIHIYCRRSIYCRLYYRFF